MPGGMDHAHHDQLFLGGKARKIGLGPDHGEGLAVDRGAVGFIDVRHQAASRTGRGIGEDRSAASSRIGGHRAAMPSRIRSKPSGVADQRAAARARDARSPWRSPRHAGVCLAERCGASARASARVSACACGQAGRAGAGDDAQQRIVGVGDRGRGCCGHLAQRPRSAASARGSGADLAPSVGESAQASRAASGRRQSRPARRQRTGRGAGRQARCGCVSPAKIIGQLRRMAIWRRHAAPPVRDTAGGHEPRPARSRRRPHRPRVTRAPVARRRRARSGRRRRRARCGYRPDACARRGSRRSRRQSRICRAGRARRAASARVKFAGE